MLPIKSGRSYTGTARYSSRSRPYPNAEAARSESESRRNRGIDVTRQRFQGTTYHLVDDAGNAILPSKGVKSSPSPSPSPSPSSAATRDTTSPIVRSDVMIAKLTAALPPTDTDAKGGSGADIPGDSGRVVGGGRCESKSEATGIGGDGDGGSGSGSGSGDCDDEDSSLAAIDYRVQSFTDNLGKFYVIRIAPDASPTCTCPDFEHRCARGDMLCKHCWFVLGRIISAPSQGSRLASALDLDVIWRLAVCRELQTFGLDTTPFGVPIRLWNRVGANKRAGTAGVEATSDNKEASPTPRFVGEDCGICMETMDVASLVITCLHQCQNSVHQSCMTQWLAFGNTTCVYCRYEFD